MSGEDKPRQRLFTKAIETNHPDLADRLRAEQDRVVALFERRKAVACRERTAALIVIAIQVIHRYETEKNRRGLLDYDDLIDKTLALLGRVESAWVHYKLDLGIDHVLIDEAQDTSPRQWKIIEALTGEFFVGAGARAVTRTVFAVGDEKQSIFSFQGAAPREFDAMRRTFGRLCRGIEQELQYIPFRHSFRSGATLLEAVDTVFARPQAYAGLSADDVKTVHEALPDAVPGTVEIWDAVKPDAKREIEAWDAPFDDVTETSPQVRLAQKVARNIRLWTSKGARPGDILVLVRQRGPLFEAIIRSLKDEGVEVAGADRLVLTEHIAVMDLMVLADALLLADDDLALATALKCPLFGLDDDDLFEIAWHRVESVEHEAVSAGHSFVDLDQLDHTGQVGTCVEVGDARPVQCVGYDRFEHRFVSQGRVSCRVCLEITGCYGKVVKAVATRIDDLAIYRRQVIMLLDQLDHHRTRKRQGDREIECGGLPSVFLRQRLEVFEHDPRCGTQARSIMGNGGLQAGHDVGDLKDLTERLAGREHDTTFH